MVVGGVFGVRRYRERVRVECCICMIMLDDTVDVVCTVS